MSLLLSSATRSQTDDAYKNKFLISDKENIQTKRDTETLILAKDSGKQFTSSSSSSGVHFGGGECYLTLTGLTLMKSGFFSFAS